MPEVHDGEHLGRDRWYGGMTATMGRYMAAAMQQGASFSPADLSSLVLWLDASVTGSITHSGGVVSAWADQSSAGNDFDTVVSGGPTTNSRTQNSLNVLDFTPNDDIGVVSVINSNPESSGMTIFLVGITDNTTSCALFAEGDTVTNNSNLWVGSASGNWHLTWRSGSTGGVSITGTASTTTASVVTAQIDVPANGAFVRVNGSVDSSTASYTAEGSLTLTNTAVGGLIRLSNTLFMNGWVGEVIVCNTVTGSTDIASTESYLNTKWSIY